MCYGVWHTNVGSAGVRILRTSCAIVWEIVRAIRVGEGQYKMIDSCIRKPQIETISCEGQGWDVAYTRYYFTLKLLCTSESSVYCLPRLLQPRMGFELYVCVCSVWVPCVALPSGGGSSVGPSPLCGSSVWVPCAGPLCVGPLCGSPLCGSPV